MEDLSIYNPEGSTLRKAQHRMLDILSIVDIILRKHNIDYWLDGGSLLGAVRHGGFIPWDDDLDIAIMNKDLPKAKKVLSAELPDNLVYQDRKTDVNYPMLIAKVRDRKSYFEEDYTQHVEEKGIYIDIIPMEKVPSLKWKKKLDYWYGHCIRGIHNYSTKGDKLLSLVVFPFAWTLVQITRQFNSFVASKQIAHNYGWAAYNSYSAGDVFPVKRMQFENIEVSVPRNSDAVLTALFGDYMQIPPVEKRATHTGKIIFYD